MQSEPGSDSNKNTTTPLQKELVDSLKRQGHIQSQQVEEAFRAIPRHLFLPGVAIQKAYKDIAIGIKQQNGNVLSSSSQPAIMARMLESLDLQPGQKVLEIGAGTGYNAALIAHIVGEAGSVTTLEIDEEIAIAAQEHLQSAGYAHVQVICGDGAFGYADTAPYDRIILTVGTDDITPAWREQLAPTGRLVVPFKLTSLKVNNAQQHWLFLDHIVLTLVHKGDYLESCEVYICGFVPLQGVFAVKTGFNVQLGPSADLLVAATYALDTQALYTALSGFRQDDFPQIHMITTELWSLRLWLALRDPRYCELYRPGQPQTLNSIPPLTHVLDQSLITYGLVENNTACLLMRSSKENTFDLVVRNFGSDRALTKRLLEHIGVWDTMGRPFKLQLDGTLTGLHILVYPTQTAYTPNPKEFVIDRKGSRFIFQSEPDPTSTLR